MTGKKKNRNGTSLAVRVIAIVLSALMVLGIATYTLYAIAGII